MEVLPEENKAEGRVILNDMHDLILLFDNCVLLSGDVNCHMFIEQFIGIMVRLYLLTPMNEFRGYNTNTSQFLDMQKILEKLITDSGLSRKMQV